MKKIRIAMIIVIFSILCFAISTISKGYKTDTPSVKLEKIELKSYPTVTFDEKVYIDLKYTTSANITLATIGFTKEDGENILVGIKDLESNPYIYLKDIDKGQQATEGKYNLTGIYFELENKEWVMYSKNEDSDDVYELKENMSIYIKERPAVILNNLEIKGNSKVNYTERIYLNLDYTGSVQDASLRFKGKNGIFDAQIHDIDKDPYIDLSGYNNIISGGKYELINIMFFTNNQEFYTYSKIRDNNEDENTYNLNFDISLEIEINKTEDIDKEETKDTQKVDEKNDINDTTKAKVSIPKAGKSFMQYTIILLIILPYILLKKYNKYKDIK